MRINRTCCAASLALTLIVTTIARAEVVKIDLRSAPYSQDFFVALCATKSARNNAFAGLAQGNLLSGYQWVEVLPYSTARGAHSVQRVTSTLDSCIQSAFISGAALFIAEIDQSIFAKSKDLLRGSGPGARKERSSGEFTSDASNFAGLVGLHVPDISATPIDYVEKLSSLNPGQNQDGVEWIWRPPTVRLVSRGDQDTTSSQTSSPPVIPTPLIIDNFIPTGLRTVPTVDRVALERFYQALADAEDNSSDYYDLEFRIQSGKLEQIYVHPIQVRRDLETEKGDSVCVFLSGDVAEVDPIELIDNLLQLSSADQDTVSGNWGFYSAHPMLGAPRNWQAAVTSPPACKSPVFMRLRVP
jgi:hypothetical protein